MAPSGGATGAFAALIEQIFSVRTGELDALATQLRGLGTDAATAAGTLAASAGEVGAQHGLPYDRYEQRLQPVATWMQQLTPPTATAADGLVVASQRALEAQWAASEWISKINAAVQTANAPGGPGAAAQPEIDALIAQAVTDLTGKVAAITNAYEAIKLDDAGAAPTEIGGTSGDDSTGTPSTTRPASLTTGDTGETGTQDDTGTTGSDDATGDTDTPGATDGTGEDDKGRVVGPETGEYNGWVKDPTTGNLVDPATGREVNAQGQFVDPITGLPFGDPSQYASRLEGLEGGVSAAGGLLSPAAGAAGLAPIGAGAGGGGGASGYAGFYGGMVPPSLMGGNPAAGQLRSRAARNLAMKAETANRFASVVGGAGGQGQQQSGYGYGYVPPMAGGGAGMGAAGTGRSGRRTGRRLVAEPSTVWGATGRGAQKQGKASSSGATEVVEDPDVWTSGAASAGSGLLGGR